MSLHWAWDASRHVDPRLKMRLKFVGESLRSPEAASVLEHADPRSALGELLAEWPETSGFLLWPYQSTAWGPRTRLDRITQHLKAIRKIPGLGLAPDEKMVLADLGEFSPDVSLILDRAPWLAREGHLTLSLFKDDFRAFTVSFSLFGDPATGVFIGGLQGRQTDGILDLYRDLTKDFEGMRPRDFMLEALRMFTVKLGLREIHAVDDGHKISRHKYFSGKNAPGIFYDDVWLERGGARIDDAHFSLPLGGSRRPLEDVAAKKRSMYRRRYEMLDLIEAALPSDLTTTERRHFDAR
jgi:uncharacterized protein VirK/YbjX